MRRITAILFILVLLVGCGDGGGGGSRGVDIPVPHPEERPPLLDLPTLQPSDAVAPPVSYSGTTLQVGTDISPPQASLTPVEGRFGVSYGRVSDGEGYESVASYLAAHAGRAMHAGDAHSAARLDQLSSPPTVHIAEGTSDLHREYIIRSVQLINEALPARWHLRIGEDVPALSPTVPTGKIYVDFARVRDWTFTPSSNMSFGVAQYFSHQDGSDRSTHIWINLDREFIRDRLVRSRTLVHEFLHALGLHAHLDRMDTIMPSSETDTTYFWEDNHTVIFPVDREGLRTAYTHLQRGDTPEAVYEKLAGWTDTSTHLMGESEFAAFGIAHRNGFAQAWARGEAPWVDLADSDMEGTLTWTGNLLGFTPAAETVVGDTEISVDLSTLQGDVLFDNLEKWAAEGPPGAVGSGSMYGDGDLRYIITVRGNTFRNTGGEDRGHLAGIFVGPNHEGATGTLERYTLTAAFGATRE